jgi:hypothetical protein
MSTSTSPASDPGAGGDGGAAAPFALPVETDIYVLPDGRVVVADLPAELASLVAELGAAEPCEIGPDVGRSGAPPYNSE